MRLPEACRCGSNQQIVAGNLVMHATGPTAGRARRRRNSCHSEPAIRHVASAALASGELFVSSVLINYDVIIIAYCCRLMLSTQNVVMVIATSSIDLLHVARQRQWRTCVSGSPSAGASALLRPCLCSLRFVHSVSGALSRLLENCVRESAVDMSADTRSKFALDKDALLQTQIAMNEWLRLATSFLDPVASLPMGSSTSLLWDCVISRWCEKEEGGRNGMSSTVLGLIAASRHGLSYVDLPPTRFGLFV